MRSTDVMETQHFKTNTHQTSKPYTKPQNSKPTTPETLNLIESRSLNPLNFQPQPRNLKLEFNPEALSPPNPKTPITLNPILPLALALPLPFPLPPGHARLFPDPVSAAMT